MVDFSIQLDVQSNRTKAVTIGRFETDNQGQYLGHHLGAMHSGLDKDLLRFIHGDGKDSQRMRRLGTQVADVVGRALQSVGYTGSVDAMIVRTPMGYRIRPIVEVNPRYTMGQLPMNSQDMCIPSLRDGLGLQRRCFLHSMKNRMRVDSSKWREGVQLLTDIQFPVVGFVKVSAN